MPVHAGHLLFNHLFVFYFLLLLLCRWTCVAVDAYPSTRILTPATHVAETSRDPMRDAPWPFFAEAIENASFTGYQDAWMTDNSYLGNHQIGKYFELFYVVTYNIAFVVILY